LDKLSLVDIIFQSVPESIIIFCLGLVSVDLTPDFKNVIPAAVVSALLSWFVRSLPLPFGIHTFIGIIIIFAIFIFWFKTKLRDAFLAAVFAMSTFLTAEAVLVPVTLRLTGIGSIHEALQHSVLRVILPIPELILLGVFTYLLAKYNVSFKTLVSKFKKGL